MKYGNSPEESSSGKVLEFLRQNDGEFSVAQVAKAVGLAPNTVGQILLSQAREIWGMPGEQPVKRRMNGVARGRHYVYWITEGGEG